MKSYVTFKNETPTSGVNNPLADEYEMLSGTSIFNMKRLIGRLDTDPAVHAGNLPFQVQTLNISARPLISVLKNNMWSFDHLQTSLKTLFGELKVMAETCLDRPVLNVVLTFPVSFNRLQLSLLTRACLEVGLRVLSLIPEPTAVALLYAQQQKQIMQENMGSGSEKVALIFNMGAGFCDVSVTTATGGVCRIRGLAGATLGGEDILQNTMRYLCPDMDGYFSRHSDEIQKMGRLRIATQDAIHKLSIKPSAEIDVDLGNGTKINKVLEREEFEEVNRDVFEKCASLINQCLHDANIEADKVNDVILVGGCSNITKIWRMVIDICGKEELYLGMNPLEAAVCGAALEGALASHVQNPSGLLELSWTQITPMSIGIRADGNSFIPIIPKNTELPARKDLLFTTVHDNQTEALILVYEGNEEAIEKNHLLGYFKITGIPQAPKGGQVIEVCMENFSLFYLRVIARVIDNDELSAPMEVWMPTVDEMGGLCAEAIYRTYGSTLDLATV